MKPWRFVLKVCLVCRSTCTYEETLNILVQNHTTPITFNMSSRKFGWCQSLWSCGSGVLYDRWICLLQTSAEYIRMVIIYVNWFTIMNIQIWIANKIIYRYACCTMYKYCYTYFWTSTFSHCYYTTYSISSTYWNWAPSVLIYLPALFYDPNKMIAISINKTHNGTHGQEVVWISINP